MPSINASDVTIRQSRKDDVKVLLQFIEEEAFDWSMYDHLAQTRLDPDYLLTAANRSGEPIGFCGLTQNGPDTVYLSTFVVHKDLRRRGIGKLLWKAMLEKAGDQNIVLDAVKGMVDWYMKNGFTFATVVVFSCYFTVTDNIKKDNEQKYDTVTLSEDMWPALMEYDRQVYPNFDRMEILRAWFSGEDVRVAVAMDAGKIVGYGSIHKKPNNKYGLRNVFGDNEEIINALLHNMISGLPEKAVVYFFKVDGKPMPKYMKHSVKIGHAIVRMYSKANIIINTNKMWLAATRMV